MILDDSAGAAVPPEQAFDESVTRLRAVASGEIAAPRSLRVYRPTPTLAMSRWESRQPGFADAERAARRLGFRPAVRPTGGRAAAYDESCLVFDLVLRESGGLDPRPLFQATSERLAAQLRMLGADARVGEVAGEYCPGEFSINAREAVKLIGTSQRAVRGARLLSGMIALGEVDRLRPIVAAANEALGLDWDPSTLAGLAAEAGEHSHREVADALIAALMDD